MVGRGLMSRLLPITAVGTFVLWFLGFWIIESGDTPDIDAPASEIATYFQDETGTILGGSVLFLFGCLLLLWFMNLTRTKLGEAEGTGGRLSSLAFAAGTGTAIILMLTRAPSMSVSIAIEDNDALIEPGAAQLVLWSDFGFFVVAELLAAVFLLALAKVALGSGLLPKWFAWISVVLAVVMLIPPIGWAGLIFVFPLWLMAAGFLLQGRTAPTPTP
jgi:hypothetical protein